MKEWNIRQWSIVLSLALFLITSFLLLAGPCIIAIVRMMEG